MSQRDPEIIHGGGYEELMAFLAEHPDAVIESVRPVIVDPVTGEERDASFPWMDDFEEDVDPEDTRPVIGGGSYSGYGKTTRNKSTAADRKREQRLAERKRLREKEEEKKKKERGICLAAGVKVETGPPRLGNNLHSHPK